MPAYMRPIPSRLRRLRLLSGYTQAEIAKEAGIHINYYGMIERGETSAGPKTFRGIAKCLGVPISEIAEVDK